MPYRLLRPAPVSQKTAGKSTFPLVVFLHGSGERGNNNTAQLNNGVLGFIEGDRMQRFPCYLLAPQCPENDTWSAIDWSTRAFKFMPEPTPTGKNLEALIEMTIRKNPQIDTSRVYIVGLSMGGFGTFELLQRRPDLFAAAIPACGGGDPAKVDIYKNIPLWIFHGQNDNSVPVGYSRTIVRALEATGHKPKYTEYTTLGHAIWQETFYDEKVLEWLFAQRKTKH